MTEQQQEDAQALIAKLDEALNAARVSATVRVVTVDGVPKLRIASTERGEALQRLNDAVSRVLMDAGENFRYLDPLT